MKKIIPFLTSNIFKFLISCLDEYRGFVSKEKIRIQIISGQLYSYNLYKSTLLTITITRTAVVRNKGDPNIT